MVVEIQLGSQAAPVSRLERLTALRSVQLAIKRLLGAAEGPVPCPLVVTFESLPDLLKGHPVGPPHDLADLALSELLA